MNPQTLCQNTTWLAPLAGFTDLPYRKIAKENGVDVLTTEMVSAAGLTYNPSASLPYAYTQEDSSPIGVQLFGSTPAHFVQAISVLPAIDFLCINMGCPVKKVVKTGAGSALMDTPLLAAQIVESCRKSLPASTPLVVKFRSGFSRVNYLQFGLRMQAAGADILILHPRTRAQMFTGHSNWEQIAQLKAACQTPVIGNGDIKSHADITKMRRQTSCDGVMIGQGAIGNPWIFSPNSPTNPEKLATIKKHYRLAMAHYGQTKGIRTMRSHIAKYTKSLPGGSIARQEINSLTDLEAIFKVLEKVLA